MKGNWIKNESAVIIFQSMMLRGTFTLDDISIYSNMLEFHYYGDEQNKRQKVKNREMTYYHAVGCANIYEYKRLRAKLRKHGLFTYNDSTKKWKINRPDDVIADWNEYKRADQPAKRRIVKRIAGTQQQLSLALAA